MGITTHTAIKRVLLVLLVIASVYSCKKETAKAVTTSNLTGKIKMLSVKINYPTISDSDSFVFLFKYDSINGTLQSVESPPHDFLFTIHLMESNKYLVRYKQDSLSYPQPMVVYTDNQNKVINITYLDTTSQIESPAFNFIYKNSTTVDTLNDYGWHQKNYNYEFDGSNYIKCTVSWDDFFTTYSTLYDSVNLIYSPLVNNKYVPCQVPYFFVFPDSNLSFGWSTNLGFILYFLGINDITVFSINKNLIQSANQANYTYIIGSNNQVKEVFIDDELNSSAQHLVLEYY